MAEGQAWTGTPPKADMPRNQAEWQQRHQQCWSPRGLHIIRFVNVTSRVAIDNQLRAAVRGRQGDPGQAGIYLVAGR